MASAKIKFYGYNTHLPLFCKFWLPYWGHSIIVLYCVNVSCQFLIVFREEVDIAASTVCAPNNNSDASSTGNVFYNIFRFCYFSVFLNRTNRLSMETQIKLCQAVGYIFSVLYCISLTTDSFIMFVSIDNVCTVLVQTCITCYSMFILRCRDTFCVWIIHKIKFHLFFHLW